MCKILTRRAMLALVSGALAVAIIAAAALFQLAQTSHAPQHAVAIHSGSSVAYTVVLAPSSHARHLQSQPNSAPSTGKTTTHAQPNVTLVDDGKAIGPTTPVVYPIAGSLLLNITLQNTGTTTWTTGYQIACVANCGITSNWPMNAPVPPKGTITLQPQMAIPVPFLASAPPTEVQWVLQNNNGVTFGSPINLQITQTVATSVEVESAPWCSNLLRWGAANLTGGNTATCIASGVVLQTTGGMGPNLWLARPPLSFAKNDYRMQVQVHFTSVTSNEWVSILMNESSWDQCPTDRLDYSPVSGYMQYRTFAGNCTSPRPPSVVWISAGVGQDMTIGVYVHQGTLYTYLNGASIMDTVAYTGGSIGLALGSAPGQAAQVTLSNFELDNNIAAYTTYVLG